MPDASPLLLIQLTPPGRGAVASLRIEGRGALDLVARHFVARSGRPLADFPPGRIVVGRFGQASSPAGRRRRGSRAQPAFRCRDRTPLPRRTGGGRPHRRDSRQRRLPANILARMDRQPGGRPDLPPPPDWPWPKPAPRGRRPFSSTSIEARCDGPSNKSSLPCKPATKDAARQQIEALLAHAATGLHLIRPWQVVVAGRPNVGKSSLINAIAGYQRAIVHSTPGTTRDIVGVQTAMDGWPVEISDTAGLRETGEKIEQAGHRSGPAEDSRGRSGRSGLRQLAAVVRAGSGPGRILSHGLAGTQQERLAPRRRAERPPGWKSARCTRPGSTPCAMKLPVAWCRTRPRPVLPCRSSRNRLSRSAGILPQVDVVGDQRAYRASAGPTTSGTFSDDCSATHRLEFPDRRSSPGFHTDTRQFRGNFAKSPKSPLDSA